MASWQDRIRDLAARWWMPLALLGAVSLASLVARLLWISEPCANPCRTPYDHGLIFDEKYYVNAARVIDGLPVQSGQPYDHAPSGSDPNAEHPQLAKLAIAAGMRVFGDGPLGWRLGSIIVGSLAILALYWLVRVAGGGRWLALGAAALMAVDNLLLVHSRIATLDIYVVTFMLAGAALYLRGNRVLAGIVLGVGACTKLATPYVLLVLLIVEGLRLWRGRAPGTRLTRAHALRVAGDFGSCLAAAVITYVAVLYILDATVPPWDDGAHVYYSNPVAHTRHMLDYASILTSPNGPEGIESYPWQWLLNQQPINYFTVNTNVLVNGKVVAEHPTIAFQGAMNPFIIFLAIPAFAAAGWEAWRRADSVSVVGVAWILGTFVPLLPLALPEHRKVYLYYMVLVLPGIYIVLARLFSRRLMPAAATVGWAGALAYGFVSLYPFRTWTGH